MGTNSSGSVQSTAGRRYSTGISGTKAATGTIEGSLLYFVPQNAGVPLLKGLYFILIIPGIS